MNDFANQDAGGVPYLPDDEATWSSAGTASISGVVRRRGLVMPHVHIVFRSLLLARIIARVITDGSGRYATCVPRGDYLLELLDPQGTLLHSCSTRVSKVETVDISFQ